MGRQQGTKKQRRHEKEKQLRQTVPDIVLQPVQVKRKYNRQRKFRERENARKRRRRLPGKCILKHKRQAILEENGLWKTNLNQACHDPPLLMSFGREDR